MIISVVSFGFKRGIPAEADWVVDVRFIPNPFYVDQLKRKTGLDPEVRDYIFSFPITREFLDREEQLITALLPHYLREDKNHMIIAVGCTGGMHRSVALAEALRDRLAKNGVVVSVTHRDMATESQQG